MQATMQTAVENAGKSLRTTAFGADLALLPVPNAA